MSALKIDNVAGNPNKQVYCSGQVCNFLPYVDSTIRWFVIGGPADGDEAQVVRKKRPDLRIFGCEPNPFMYKLQKDSFFPGKLVQVGLWNEPGEMVLKVPENDDPVQMERSSSLCKFGDEFAKEYTVRVDTLDRLSAEHGPFRKIALWIDIEDAELECLKGACVLLRQKHIKVINAEVYAEREEEMASFLFNCGLEEVHRWGEMRIGDRKWCNIIYKLQTG